MVLSLKHHWRPADLGSLLRPLVNQSQNVNGSGERYAASLGVHTYFRAADFDLAQLGPATPGLLVVELQVLQSLRQGQLLLDGHAQQRVQRLLLVLRRRQLPLHVVQLRHVLVTPAGAQGHTL